MDPPGGWGVETTPSSGEWKRPEPQAERETGSPGKEEAGPNSSAGALHRRAGMIRWWAGRSWRVPVLSGVLVREFRSGCSKNEKVIGGGVPSCFERTAPFPCHEVDVTTLHSAERSTRYVFLTMPVKLARACLTLTLESNDFSDHDPVLRIEVVSEIGPEDQAGVIELESLRGVDASTWSMPPGSVAQRAASGIPGARRLKPGLAFQGRRYSPTTTSATRVPSWLGFDHFQQ